MTGRKTIDGIERGRKRVGDVPSLNVIRSTVGDTGTKRRREDQGGRPRNSPGNEEDIRMARMGERRRDLNTVRRKTRRISFIRELFTGENNGRGRGDLRGVFFADEIPTGARRAGWLRAGFFFPPVRRVSTRG